MKGKTPSAEQKRYHNLLAQEIGCIACHRDTAGHHRNTHVSIHHIDGRSKPNAHWLVLPLCAGHHQDGTGQQGMIAVHPYKARFEARYGKQETLAADCAMQLMELGFEIPETVARLFGVEGMARTINQLAKEGKV